MAGRWAETMPEQMREFMAEASFPWWIAGGWALELWLGRPIREHSDIEIGCFRDDLPSLVAHLSGWDIAIARQKRLTPFSDAASLPEPPYSLWARRGGKLWDFEVLIEDRTADRWRYRRNGDVTLPLANLTLVTPAGYRVIAPEVQLLFKSTAPRPKDEDDFAAAAPVLTSQQRHWLRSVLAIVDPTHAWIAQLTA